MTDRTSNIQFRSVPLIQRTEMSRAASRNEAAREQAMRGEAARMRQSAYAGESGVVSVTRRSERRARRESSLDGVAASRGARSSTRESGRLRVVSGERRTSSEGTRTRVSSAGTYTRTRTAPDAPRERRTGPFDEGDSSSMRSIPGSARRRASVAAGVRAVPEGIASLAGAAIRTPGILASVLVLVLVAMLYTPVRNLYVAHRQLETLQATYDALSTENEAIQHDLEVLQTREGIENEARARGYVSVGETKVVVEGLPEGETSSDKATAAVAEVSVPDTREWYVRALDAVFAFDPQA